MVELINKKGEIVACKMAQVKHFIDHGFEIHKATVEERKTLDGILNKKQSKPVEVKEKKIQEKNVSS